MNKQMIKFNLYLKNYNKYKNKNNRYKKNTIK